MEKKHILFVIIVLAILLSLLVLCSIIYTYYSSFTTQNYNRAVYSVVVHNKTNLILNNIYISYGCDIKIKDSTILFETINNLKPNEYRKVNIPTNSPNKNVEPPYNVWLSVQTDESIQSYAGGYFGIDTGGLAVFNATMDGDVIEFQRVYENEKKYKRIHKRNKKNQQEISWY